MRALTISSVTIAQFRRAFDAWNDHDDARMGAALAFYTILSLAPLVIIVIALLGFAFGTLRAQEFLLTQIQSMVGQDGSDLVKSMIMKNPKPSEGIVASLVGVITLLLGASGVFEELRSALNRIWDVQPVEESTVKRMIRARVFAFGMVLAIGFLLLVSLMVSSALTAMGTYFSGYLPMPHSLLRALDLLISLLGVGAMFALIFKYVPAAYVSWQHVIRGALITSFLFTIGKYAIGLYLGNSAIASAYGAAGSLIVIIIWVYYSAQIFLLGAEYTHLLAVTPNVKTIG